MFKFGRWRLVENRCGQRDLYGASARVELVFVGSFGYARRERLRRSTAGLDPILSEQEASPAVTIAATPDRCATPLGVSA